MEESNLSFAVVVIIAVLAAGGVGLGVTNTAKNDAELKIIKLNILPSQKFTTADGTEYHVGDELRLPAGEKLVGTYSSEKCPSETRKIDVDYSPVYSGVPLCEADCSDDNRKNLELLSDSVETCDAYFERQRTGTATEEPSSEPEDDNEQLEDFPENYVFGEEVK